MLVIRNTQVSALTEQLREYEEHALEFIGREYPAQLETRGEPGCRQLIQSAWAKAQRYRMSRSSHVTGLLSLMLVFGEDFETDVPQRQAVLDSPLDADDKLDALLEAMLDEHGQ